MVEPPCGFPYIEPIGVLFGCFGFQNRWRFLVYLVVKSSTRATTTPPPPLPPPPPKRTPTIEPVTGDLCERRARYRMIFQQAEEADVSVGVPSFPAACQAAPAKTYRRRRWGTPKKFVFWAFVCFWFVLSFFLSFFLSFVLGGLESESGKVYFSIDGFWLASLRLRMVHSRLV